MNQPGQLLRDMYEQHAERVRTRKGRLGDWLAARAIAELFGDAVRRQRAATQSDSD